MWSFSSILKRTHVKSYTKLYSKCSYRLYPCPGAKVPRWPMDFMSRVMDHGTGLGIHMYIEVSHVLSQRSNNQVLSHLQQSPPRYIGKLSKQELHGQSVRVWDIWYNHIHSIILTSREQKVAILVMTRSQHPMLVPLTSFYALPRLGFNNWVKAGSRLSTTQHSVKQIGDVVWSSPTKV